MCPVDLSCDDLKEISASGQLENSTWLFPSFVDFDCDILRLDTKTFYWDRTIGGGSLILMEAYAIKGEIGFLIIICMELLGSFVNRRTCQETGGRRLVSLRRAYCAAARDVRTEKELDGSDADQLLSAVVPDGHD